MPILVNALHTEMEVYAKQKDDILKEAKLLGIPQIYFALGPKNYYQLFFSTQNEDNYYRPFQN